MKKILWFPLFFFSFLNPREKVGEQQKKVLRVESSLMSHFDDV